jgi:hypothetical protein
MKSFQDFINEAKLKGNLGVPEEKLKEIERKAQQEKGIRIDDRGQERQVGPQLMGLVQRSRQLLYGGKSKRECDDINERLVDLAQRVIMTEYGDILQNVELDIRMVPFGEVADEIPEIGEVEATPSQQRQREEAERLNQEDEEEQKEESTDKKKSFLDNLFGAKPKKEKEDWLKSQEYKFKVDVAKLINAVGQGEAKNTKHILHSDIVKDGLREIFGRQSEEIFKVWDETSKAADKLDWLVPIDFKAQMMADNMGGMAGAVKVSWPEAEEAEESEEGPSSQDAEDILKNIEEGQDLNDNSEEISELLSNGNPKITAIGVDFPMLLHEAVKGIYQLIGSAWLPEEGASEKEKTKAEIVKSATSSFEDEAEDFRYGPYLAAALRDFVNECPNVDRYPNMKEYVWGDMCYMARTNPKAFLDLFKGILEKTPAAKKQITDMISDIIERIREFEVSEIDEPKEPQYSEPESEFEEPSEAEEDEIEKLIKKTQEEPVVGSEVDYSTLSRRQLDDELNDALDRGDKKALDAISKELQKRNESVMLQIYGEEIMRVLKS